jgi:hypothetical protein
VSEEAPDEIFDRLDRTTHRRLTLLSVVCRGCGKPLLEIVATQPYWLLRTRERKHSATRRHLDGQLYDRPAGTTPKEWASQVLLRRAQAGVTKPRGRGKWVNSEFPRHPETHQPVPGAFVDETHQYVESVCDCRTFDTTMAWLYRKLAEGKGTRSRVVV